MDGIDLRIAQLEMVLTHPSFRSQGLVRAQMKNYLQAVYERGFDLSIIWGIPYYYRQYGYAYAMDGDTYESLPAYRIPDAADLKDRVGGVGACQMRPARVADVPALAAFYVHAVQNLNFHLARSAAQWQYLLLDAQHPIQIIEDQDGRMLGHAIVALTAGRVFVREAALPGGLACWGFLPLLKAIGQPEICIAWPQTTPLVQLARSLGSTTVRDGQWLLRIPDMGRLLTKLGPLFEQRVAASPWHSGSFDLTINLFREAFRLHFLEGQWRGLDALGFVDSSMGADGGDLCIPPDAFTRLLFGYRRLDELLDAWPDMVIKPHVRALLDVIFPSLASYLSTPYHFQGVVQAS